MRGLLLTLVIAVYAASCSCQDTGITGVPDAVDDAHPDPVEDVEPACWDRDDDGYRDEACGGDDCDDSDPTVHPGADDVCLDGVDRDCDGIVDGPMLMGEPLQLTHNIDEYTVPPYSGPIWTSSSYAIAWAQIEEMDGEMVHHLALLSPEGEPVIESPATDGEVHIDWSGSSFGVMRSVLDDVYFRLLDPLFVPVSEEVPILTGDEHDPLGVIWAGDSFFVCWEEKGGSWENAKCSRVSTSGDVLEPPTYVTHLSSWDMYSTSKWDLESMGSSFALFWTAIPFEGPDDTRDLFFTTWWDGTTGEGDYVEIISNTERLQFSIAWTGSEFGLVRNHCLETTPPEHSIIFTRVDESGRRIVEDSLLDVFVGCPDLDVAWTGSEFGTLYYDAPAGLVFLHNDLAGSSHGRTILAESPMDVLDPSLAWSGSEFGASWIERVSGVRQLFFGRIGFCE